MKHLIGTNIHSQTDSKMHLVLVAFICTASSAIAADCRQMSSRTGDFMEVSMQNYECLLNKHSTDVGRYYCNVSQVSRIEGDEPYNIDFSKPFEIEIMAHPIDEAIRSCERMGITTTGEAEYDGQLCGNPFELVINGENELARYYDRSPNAMVFQSVALGGSFVLFGREFTIFDPLGTAGSVMMSGSCEKVAY